MNKPALVSVIIPVYNGSNYMREAIDSACNQTYPEVEIIVVNDGSKDEGKTEKIAQSYSKKIKYFNKLNGGVASALNYGIKQAQGQYISWLSHDDVYRPNKIQRLIEAIDGLEENVIPFSDYAVIDAHSKQLFMNRMNHHELRRKPLYAILRGAMHGCSMLLPTRVFTEFGYFDENLKTTQDLYFWFKIRQHYHFYHIPEILIESRFHTEQGSKKNPGTNREANALWIYFADTVTTEEIYQCENSKYAFYSKLHHFLATHSSYSQARNYVKKLATRYKAELPQEQTSIKVSVIIPFYNRIPFLLEAVDSALQQTHQNIEILLIDNCSSENLTQVKQLVQENPQIQLLYCKRKGAAAARNVGLEHAAGDYIAFLDSDDLWTRKKLERQLAFMLREGCQMSFTSYELFDKKNNKNIISRHPCDTGYLEFPLILVHCQIATPTVMIKKSFIDFYSLRFDESLMAGEDTYFWLQVAYYEKIALLKNFYVLVRDHEQRSAVNKEVIFRSLLMNLANLLRKYQWHEYKDFIKPIIRKINAYSQMCSQKNSSAARRKNTLHEKLIKYPLLKRICLKLWTYF